VRPPHPLVKLAEPPAEVLPIAAYLHVEVDLEEKVDSDSLRGAIAAETPTGEGAQHLPFDQIADRHHLVVPGAGTFGLIPDAYFIGDAVWVAFKRTESSMGFAMHLGLTVNDDVVPDVRTVTRELVKYVPRILKRYTKLSGKHVKDWRANLFQGGDYLHIFLPQPKGYWGYFLSAEPVGAAAPAILACLVHGIANFDKMTWPYMLGYVVFVGVAWAVAALAIWYRGLRSLKWQLDNWDP
jgi:hypothetical protein